MSLLSGPSALPAHALMDRPRIRAFLAGAFSVRALAVPLTILSVAIFITVFDNDVLWAAALNATASDEHQAGIVASLFVIVLCALIIPLALALGVRVLKTVAIALLLAAAVGSFFMSSYGTVIDTTMFRSIADTDVREAAPLLTTGFFVHLGIFGLVPAALVAFAPIARLGWGRELALRAGLVTVSLAVSAAVLYWNYAPFAFFAGQNHQLRLLINPHHALYSGVQYLVRSGEEARLERILLDAHINGALRSESEKPTLVVLVLGETARSDRFSLNGYERDTNRYTPALGVRNLGPVIACGTSTADSLPCLFSQFGRADFDQAEATRHENLFSVLGRLGVNVAWLDNSTGCKDICDPAHFEEFAGREDPDLCDSTGCFDEILIEGLARAIGDTSRDQFIVMHQRGSHGPAYYTDVPAWAKAFQPECDLPNLRNCSRDAINNSYDNTILYTDFFLARVIEFLSGRTDDFATAMIYVSDHGESLGENGLYLHGFPYAIAPREQTQVPMLLWTDGTFGARHHVDAECVPTASDAPLSHDFVFHTVLPIFGVKSPAYRPDLDLLAGCREGSGPNHLDRTVLSSQL